MCVYIYAELLSKYLATYVYIYIYGCGPFGLFGSCLDFQMVTYAKQIESRLPTMAQMFLICPLCSELGQHQHFKVPIKSPSWDLTCVQENTSPRLGPARLLSWLGLSRVCSSKPRPRLTRPSPAQLGPAQSGPPQPRLR